MSKEAYQSLVQAEKDQHLAYTVNEFCRLVEEYGARRVLIRMSENAYWALLKEMQ